MKFVVIGGNKGNKGVTSSRGSSKGERGKRKIVKANVRGSRVTAGSVSQSRLPADRGQVGLALTVAAADRCREVSLPGTIAKVTQGQARSQAWKCPCQAFDHSFHPTSQGLWVCSRLQRVSLAHLWNFDLNHSWKAVFPVSLWSQSIMDLSAATRVSPYMDITYRDLGHSILLTSCILRLESKPP